MSLAGYVHSSSSAGGVLKITPFVWFKLNATLGPINVLLSMDVGKGTYALLSLPMIVQLAVFFLSSTTP